MDDPVRAALSGAQRMSRSQRRSAGSLRGSSRGARRRSGDGGVTRGGFSGAHPDETDPQPVGDVVAGYLSDRGWERPLSEARLFSDWATVVGTDVAAHCNPTSLRDGELRIAAESTAWATQLRLLAGTVLARIRAEIGPEVVTRIAVTGPVAPSWKRGPWSMHGGRGPRDTYG